MVDRRSGALKRRCSQRGAVDHLPAALARSAELGILAEGEELGIEHVAVDRAVEAPRGEITPVPAELARRARTAARACPKASRCRRVGTKRMPHASRDGAVGTQRPNKRPVAAPTRHQLVHARHQPGEERGLGPRIGIQAQYEGASERRSPRSCRRRIHGSPSARTCAGEARPKLARHFDRASVLAQSRRSSTADASG